MKDRLGSQGMQVLPNTARASADAPEKAGDEIRAVIIPFWVNHPNYIFVNCSCGHTIFRLVCDIAESDEIRSVAIVCANCGETTSCPVNQPREFSNSRLQCGCGRTHWAIDLDSDGCISALECTECGFRMRFNEEGDG